jgi:hypothetical protein
MLFDLFGEEGASKNKPVMFKNISLLLSGFVFFITFEAI